MRKKTDQSFSNKVRELSMVFCLFVSIVMNVEASSYFMFPNEIQSVTETPEMDNKLISISVNGEDCTDGNATAVSIYTESVENIQYVR